MSLSHGQVGAGFKMVVVMNKWSHFWYIPTYMQLQNVLFRRSYLRNGNPCTCKDRFYIETRSWCVYLGNRIFDAIVSEFPPPIRSRTSPSVGRKPDISWTSVTSWPGELPDVWRGQLLLWSHTSVGAPRSPVTRLFVQQLVQANSNEKSLITCPLWGESTGHRWIPLTKSK